jgi:hypothetical protein
MWVLFFIINSILPSVFSKDFQICLAHVFPAVLLVLTELHLHTCGREISDGSHEWMILQINRIFQSGRQSYHTSVGYASRLDMVNICVRDRNEHLNIWNGLQNALETLYTVLTSCEIKKKDSHRWTSATRDCSIFIFNDKTTECLNSSVSVRLVHAAWDVLSIVVSFLAQVHKMLCPLNLFCSLGRIIARNV